MTAYVPLRTSAISFSRIAPSLITRQYGSVTSTVVAPRPVTAPPSSTRSTLPSITPNTSMPLDKVGCPERFALVEMSGWLSLSSIAVAAVATGLPREDESKLFRSLLRHSLILAGAIGLVVFVYAAAGGVKR